jgi:hypothetical protein
MCISGNIASGGSLKQMMICECFSAKFLPEPFVPSSLLDVYLREIRRQMLDIVQYYLNNRSESLEYASTSSGQGSLTGRFSSCPWLSGIEIGIPYDEKYEQGGQDYPYGFVRWTVKRNFEAVLNLMESHKLNVMPLISRQIPWIA